MKIAIVHDYLVGIGGLERISKHKVLRDTLHNNDFLQAARFNWDDVANKIKTVLAELER
jgi:hypothetical protein